MGDQRITFTVGPVLTQDNDLRTSGTGLQNWPLSLKGLICMPCNRNGIRTRCQFTPTGTPVALDRPKIVVAKHRSIMKSYLLMSSISPALV